MKKPVKKFMVIKRILQSNVKFVSGNLIQFIIWNHIFKCVEKVLICGKCTKVFDDVKSFEIHISVCTGESK